MGPSRCWPYSRPLLCHARMVRSRLAWYAHLPSGSLRLTAAPCHNVHRSRNTPIFSQMHRLGKFACPGMWAALDAGAQQVEPLAQPAAAIWHWAPPQKAAAGQWRCWPHKCEEREGEWGGGRERGRGRETERLNLELERWRPIHVTALDPQKDR